MIQWKSYDIGGLIIEETVRGAIFRLFKNLELKHGQIFVSRVNMVCLNVKVECSVVF